MMNESFMAGDSQCRSVVMLLQCKTTCFVRMNEALGKFKILKFDIMQCRGKIVRKLGWEKNEYTSAGYSATFDSRLFSTVFSPSDDLICI